MSPRRARTSHHDVAGGPVTTCHYGHCRVQLCPRDLLVVSVVGPYDCPCNWTPGRLAPHLDQQSRPHPPIKAVGRHGSRVQRAQHRHRPPAWFTSLADALADRIGPPELAHLTAQLTTDPPHRPPQEPTR